MPFLLDLTNSDKLRIASGAARSLFSQVLLWLGALRWLVSLVVHGSVRSAQAWPQRCALSLALCAGGSRCRSARRRVVAVCVASCASSINHSTQTPTCILTLLRPWVNWRRSLTQRGHRGRRGSEVVVRPTVQGKPDPCPIRSPTFVVWRKIYGPS